VEVFGNSISLAVYFLPPKHNTKTLNGGGRLKTKFGTVFLFCAFPRFLGLVFCFDWILIRESE
jgi:hypothetical protein